MLGSLVDASPVLETVPADKAMSPAFIEGATVHEPQSHVLGTELSPLLDYIDTATEVRIATPRIDAGFARRLQKTEIIDGESAVEMIAPAEVHEWLVADRRTPGTLEQPHISFRRSAVPFSFGLSIFDRQYAAITAFSERGVAGCIVNDSERAIHWAEDQYERVKADAEPVNFRKPRRDIDLN